MTTKQRSRIWRKSSFRFWSFWRTWSASEVSRVRMARSESSICDSTWVAIRSRSSRSESSSRRNSSLKWSAEPPGYVVLGPLVLRPVEELDRGTELDELAEALDGIHQHEGGVVGHPPCLLHVVGH